MFKRNSRKESTYNFAVVIEKDTPIVKKKIEIGIRKVCMSVRLLEPQLCKTRPITMKF